LYILKQFFTSFLKFYVVSQQQIRIFHFKIDLEFSSFPLPHLPRTRLRFMPELVVFRAKTMQGVYGLDDSFVDDSIRRIITYGSILVN
jgi:hypothetical protein